MPEIKLYNTLTRKKEIFQPLSDKIVGIYCCGPTVYNYAHIGNLRTYIFEDILRRVLEYNGYQVNHIRNYTDVGHLTSDEDFGEDKIEKSAKQEGRTAWEIADFYIKQFEEDAAALNLLKPDREPRATEHIKEQIELIKILEKRGFTYIIEDGVYFDTSKLKDYGRLARLDVKNLKAGARVKMTTGKKNPTDFALWKFSPAKGPKRQMEWDSPWAPPSARFDPDDPSQKGKVKGFPGWHLECSAMSKKYLGEQFDIHCGAIDLIPVHHTNEIAQSQAAFGKIPARFWLHGEFVLIDGEKMSKSKNNFYTLSTLTEKGFNPLAFRYLVLTAHYRSKLNFTWESLSAAQNALNNLYKVFSELDASPSPKRKNDSSFLGETAGDLKNIPSYRAAFLSAINDDLNIPEALSVVWQIIKDDNISDTEKKSFLLDFDKILGLGLNKIKKSVVEIPAKIKELAEARAKARQEKNWQKADELRKEIEKAGYKIEDTKEGTKILQ